VLFSTVFVRLVLAFVAALWLIFLPSWVASMTRPRPYRGTGFVCGSAVWAFVMHNGSMPGLGAAVVDILDRQVQLVFVMLACFPPLA
jgi:hypothetical protein